MSQPKWSCVANLGDSIEYGSAFVYVDTTGVYDPEMEMVEPPCDDDPKGPYMIYRVCLEPHTFRGGVLSDNSFHPAHPAWYWYGTGDKWHKPGLLDVCESCDNLQADLIGLLCNTDPIKRAAGYQILISYYGLSEFDSYPVDLGNNLSRVAFRYRTEIRRTTDRRPWRVGYLNKDRRERCNLKRGRFVNAWRIVDHRGRDMVQPWSDTKGEARRTAKDLRIALVEKGAE
jgi:hypothetical protein